MTDIVEQLRVAAVETFALSIATVTDAAADEIERLRNARRWIPVEEQLPAEGVMVIGWDKADGMVLTTNVGVSQSGHRIWFGCSPNAGEYEDAKRYSDPTHWMPLPAPPSDDK